MTKFKNFKLKIRRCVAGFTLIELLVVISIMGVISATVVPNVVGFTAKGRDARRKQDLKQIQLALEMYKQDKGIYRYPLPACGQPLVYTPNSSPILLASAVSDQSQLLATACSWYRPANGICQPSDGLCCNPGLVCSNPWGIGQCVCPGYGKGDYYGCLTPTPTPTPTNTPTPTPTNTPTPTPTPIPPGYIRYLKETPCDPQTKKDYGYYSPPNGLTYTLYACIENESDTGPNIESAPPFDGASCPNNKYYVLRNAK